MFPSCSSSFQCVPQGCSQQLGGTLEGRFLFRAVFEWTVQCLIGQWTFHVSFTGEGGEGPGVGRRICFPFSQWEGPRCLAFTPFKFGAGKDFFVHFSLFPNVFPRCSLYVPNEFPICSQARSPYKHLTFNPYVLTNLIFLSPIQAG